MIVTQKQAILNIIETMDSEPCMYQFLSNWLEDINWHGENTKLIQSLPDGVKKRADDMEELDYIIHSGNYSKTFIAEFIATHPETVRAVEEGDGNGIHYNGSFYSRNTLDDFRKAQQFYSPLCYIYGWGITTTDWTSGGSGDEFVAELQSMVKSIIDEKDKVRNSYNQD